MTDHVEDAAVPPRPSRRKACDLCVRKKIKCDMLQPTCSNCTLYKTSCKITKSRRETMSSARVRAAQRMSKSFMSDSEKTEERLARIEMQLEKLISLQSAQTTLSWPLSDSASEADSEPLVSTDLQSEFVSTPTACTSLLHALSIPAAAGITLRDDYPLPPLDEILPLVKHYFESFSSMVPLFEKTSFVCMLECWFTDPSTRNNAIWAAIQVVLAIAIRTPVPDTLHNSHGLYQHQEAKLFLKNAQSVVSDLVTREQDLLGLQVLLGIALLFQNSRDSSPASVIIGTALRLAHRMGLHSKAHNRNRSREENLQRQRLFWIAYTLDKDISLRIGVPSVQADSDVDVDIPSIAPSPDGLGVLFTRDRASSFHYHRAMVHLAQLEGKVYDWLYSNTATKLSRAIRQTRVQQLDRMISQWYSSIPSLFRMENVKPSIGECQYIQMTKMYHTYLLVLVKTFGIGFEDGNWVRAIKSGDSQVIRALVMGASRNGIAENSVSLLPGAWPKVLDVSRGCIRMFGKCMPTECLIWQCCSPHFSGMMILLANLLTDPGHPDASADEVFSADAIRLFDRVVDVLPDWKTHNDTRLIIAELHERAVRALHEARLTARLDTPGSLLQSTNLWGPPNADPESLAWTSASRLELQAMSGVTSWDSGISF